MITRINALITAGTLTPSTLDVGEFNFESTSYTYPCIRVRINSLVTKPKNGSCQPVVAALEAIAYSELPSSSEASSLAKVLATNLKGTVLTVDGNKTTPLRIMQIAGPVPLSSQRGWAEHVMAECEVPSS